MKRYQTKFMGRAAPWAEIAAIQALKSLVAARSHVTISGEYTNGKTCMIIPEIGSDQIRFYFLYGLKRAGYVIRHTHVREGQLSQSWRKWCRGFLICEVDPARSPYPIVTDHNATVRAANELSDTFYINPPPLAEIDAALGTTLEASVSPTPVFVA